MTDNRIEFLQSTSMSTDIQPRLIQTERMNGGLVITFDNGKSALYSASLLYAMFSQADEMLEMDEDEE